MSDENKTESVQSANLQFITWHNANGDMHVRTDSILLFISKKQPELQVVIKALPRGAIFQTVGSFNYSKALSTQVFTVDTILPL